MKDGLPVGFRVRLRADLIRADGGAVLIGGSPTRAIRLSDRARDLLSGPDLRVTDASSAALARRLLEGNLADPVLGDKLVSTDELTVVVPVRDRADQLDRCLAGLVGMQVIVVDDASIDPAAVAEVARRHGVSVVSLGVNVGPAAARNVGLLAVMTPLVAFVDSDVVVEGDVLLRLARHFADPCLALVGPRVVGVSRSVRQRWFERYDAAASSLDLGHRPGQVRPGAAIGWLPSACLVGRTSDLRAARGFAAELRVAEDVDLAWRLIDAGRAVRYDPTVHAHHDARASLLGWLGRKVLYGTGGADLAARHGDKVAPASLSLGMAVGGAAVLQRRWWSAPVAAAVVGWVAHSLRPKLPIRENATAPALRLSARGLGWAVRQESGLLLRHWWPLGLLGALVSRRIRRAVLTAVVVDTAVFVKERPGIDVPTVVIARRLDDLAYGAGLWWGAIRRAEPRCLLPRGAGSGSSTRSAQR